MLNTKSLQAPISQQSLKGLKVMILVLKPGFVGAGAMEQLVFGVSLSQILLKV